MAVMRPLTADDITVGDRIEVVRWIHREPQDPLEGWLAYKGDGWFLLTSSPDDKGGLENPDTQTFMRARFLYENVTIHPHHGGIR